jgi:hypothetical protein
MGRTPRERCRHCGTRTPALRMHLRTCRMNPERVERPAALTPDGIGLQVSVRVSINELSKLSPEQLEAFMAGMAKVVTASGR